MSKQVSFDLIELDRFTYGDETFRNELIGIFIGQIPVFIKNLNEFSEKKEWDNLAREAHTAKSSVLIFGMQNTGSELKEIQNLAETRNIKGIPQLIQNVVVDLGSAMEFFGSLLK